MHLVSANKTLVRILLGMPITRVVAELLIALEIMADFQRKERLKHKFMAHGHSKNIMSASCAVQGLPLSFIAWAFVSDYYGLKSLLSVIDLQIYLYITNPLNSCSIFKIAIHFLFLMLCLFIYNKICFLSSLLLVIHRRLFAST